MKDKILNPTIILNALFVAQLFSFSSIKYYEEEKNIDDKDFSSGYYFSIILSSLFCIGSFINLNHYTYKSNNIAENCPQYKFLYYIRYLKNLIFGHVLLSMYMRDYLNDSISFSINSSMLLGWLTIIYIFLSTYGGYMSKNKSNIVLILMVGILMFNGFVFWLGYEVVYNDLYKNIDLDNWKFIVYLFVIISFIVATVVISFVINIEDLRSTLYIQLYFSEQIFITSIIYSLLYYNKIIYIVIFIIMSVSIYSDRIYHLFIDKYLVERDNKKNNIV